MLGMMNCPTSDNMEFYASSPSALRQLKSNSISEGNSAAKLDSEMAPLSASSSELAIGEGLEKRSSSNALEIFSGSKQCRPKLSYTEDGRRLINGKLESGHSTPEKLWSRLIVDSVTTNKLRSPQNSSQTELEADDEEQQKQPQETKQKRRFSIGAMIPLFTRKQQQQQKPLAEQKKKSSAASSSSGSSTRSSGAQSI